MLLGAVTLWGAGCGQDRCCQVIWRRDSYSFITEPQSSTCKLDAAAVNNHSTQTHNDFDIVVAPADRSYRSTFHSM